MEKKYICHVPIEQYGFISVEIEGTAEDALEAYQEISHAKKGGINVSSKDFNDFIDTYISTGRPPEKGFELWENMSTEQKVIINHIKKHFNRAKQ